MHFLPLTSRPASLLQEPSEVRAAGPGTRAERQTQSAEAWDSSLACLPTAAHLPYAGVCGELCPVMPQVF